MDKILFENVLRLTDLHPAMQRRVAERRARRGVRGQVAPIHSGNRHMERQLRAERMAEISLEAGLVAVALP